jgi:hypothetical protein
VEAALAAVCTVQLHDNGDKLDDWQLDAIVPKGGTYKWFAKGKFVKDIVCP